MYDIYQQSALGVKKCKVNKYSLSQACPCPLPIIKEGAAAIIFPYTALLSIHDTDRKKKTGQTPFSIFFPCYVIDPVRTASIRITCR